jgi:hypothetical protein
MRKSPAPHRLAPSKSQTGMRRTGERTHSRCHRPGQAPLCAVRQGLEPKLVEHLQFGITWDVTGILDRWEHPGSPEQTLGKPVLTKWWQLKVSWPLRGHLAERGVFMMEVRAYGDPPGWWIIVG